MSTFLSLPFSCLRSSSSLLSFVRSCLHLVAHLGWYAVSASPLLFLSCLRSCLPTCLPSDPCLPTCLQGKDFFGTCLGFFCYLPLVGFILNFSAGFSLTLFTASFILNFSAGFFLTLFTATDKGKEKISPPM